jgi:glucosamine--fructose-6-phosphate aminotransferase (isomerizing)
VSQLEGATLYRVEGLDPLGRPTESSTIHTVQRTGCAVGIASRSEESRPLSGTKWGVVKRSEIYLGYGMTDGRRILIAPVIGERPAGHLVLYHIDLVPRGRRDVRLRALRARDELLEKLQIAITERNLPWDEELLDSIDNDVLFFESSDAVAEELLEEGGGGPEVALPYFSEIS